MERISLDTIRLKFVWVLLPILLFFSEPSPSSFLCGVIVVLIGLGIRLWAAGFIEKYNSLTTAGPYAHTRNPLYLGTLFIGLGFALVSNEFLMVVVCSMFFCFVYVPKILQEVTDLEERFGVRYRMYAKEVPLVFPQHRPYQEPLLGDHHNRFRFRRYLFNREWEALLGSVLVFILLFLKYVL